MLHATCAIWMLVTYLCITLFAFCALSSYIISLGYVLIYVLSLVIFFLYAFIMILIT